MPAVEGGDIDGFVAAGPEVGEGVLSLMALRGGCAGKFSVIGHGNGWFETDGRVGGAGRRGQMVFLSRPRANRGMTRFAGLQRWRREPLGPSCGGKQ